MDGLYGIDRILVVSGVEGMDGVDGVDRVNELDTDRVDKYNEVGATLDRMEWEWSWKVRKKMEPRVDDSIESYFLR